MEHGDAGMSICCGDCGGSSKIATRPEGAVLDSVRTFVAAHGACAFAVTLRVVLPSQAGATTLDLTRHVRRRTRTCQA